MSGAEPTARRSRWLLAFAAAIAVIAACSPRDLWAPDEQRYGRIAYDMERGGDWLVTRWNGTFDAEKPPLGYWIMAGAGRVVGEVDARAARIPCALMAVLAVLATAALGRRWFGDPALGDTAALLFATSGLVLWNSSRAGLDLPLTACALLATWAGTVFVERPSLRAALAAGAAVGLGVLFKGPHALYVPVAAVVGGCLASGQARRLLDPRWLGALGALLLVVAAWLVPVLLWGGEEYRERLLGQLQSRISGRGEPHSHAFPYLIGLLLACGLPWTPAWGTGLWTAFRARRAPAQDRFGLGAALTGALVPLLLLSLAVSKRDVYLIPLLPCFALLAAYALHRRPAARTERRSAVWFAVCAAGLGVAALAAPLVIPHLLPEGPLEVVRPEQFTTGLVPWVLIAIGLALLGGAALAWRWRSTPVASARILGLVLGSAWIACALFLLPVFDDVKTWSSAVPTLQKEAQGARLVQLGAPCAALVWAIRPAEVELPSVAYEDIPARVDALYAPGAPPVVTILQVKYWDQAQAQHPALSQRASVLWSRRAGHRLWIALVPRR